MNATLNITLIQMILVRIVTLLACCVLVEAQMLIVSCATSVISGKPLTLVVLIHVTLDTMKMNRHKHAKHVIYIAQTVLDRLNKCA